MYSQVSSIHINPVMRVTTVIIVTLGTLSWGETIDSPDSDGLYKKDPEQTVVLEIGNVNQPDNCSEFLNDLEVSSIWFLKSDLQSGLTLKIQFWKLEMLYFITSCEHFTKLSHIKMLKCKFQNFKVQNIVQPFCIISNETLFR